MRSNMKTKGFTLAEVLITLTIIGVIAAITIPNLMQNYRKHERITQIKTAYSIIQNAVRMSVAENGDTYTWDSVSIKTHFLPFVKYQYYCGAGTGLDVFVRSGCFYNNGSNSNGTWFDLRGDSTRSSASFNPKWYFTLKLQNGMDLGIKVEKDNIYFMVDVNGQQGPTTTGVDVFEFTLTKSDGKVITSKPHGYNTNWTVANMLNCTNNKCCNVNANEAAGVSCASVIEKNGWEFPDNYPVKKF